jgi:hypothetical protein
MDRTHPWILESATQSNVTADDLKAELSRRAEANTTASAAAPAKAAAPAESPHSLSRLKQACRMRVEKEESNTLAPHPGPFCDASLTENVLAAEAFPPEVREHIDANSPGLFAQPAARTTMATNLRANLDSQTQAQPEPEASPKRPPTEAQINANRENAQKSTRATTPEGKATVSQNRRTHGLAGHFQVLPWENAEDFRLLAHSIYEEHKPASPTEQRLVDSMVQHYWLKQRAISLQDETLLASAIPTEVDSKKLSLFLRYQSTHERSYYKAEKELHNLKKTSRKEEIGFESQKREIEAHEANVRLANARAMNLEIDTAARQVMEAAIPGNFRISFEELTKACTTSIALLVGEKQRAMEAQKA